MKNNFLLATWMPRGNCGSMKIQILSDIHLEFSHYQIETVEDTDIIIIAGDFTTARKLGELKAFSQSVRKQVFFVAGNHDYYGFLHLIAGNNTGQTTTVVHSSPSNSSSISRSLRIV